MNEALTCKEKLALLEKEFDSFTYIVSHDIKAPLRAVNNLTEWISEDLDSENYEEVKVNLNILGKRVTRLQKMMDALTEVSRVHKQQFIIEDYDVAIELNKLIEDYPSDIQFSMSGNFVIGSTCRTPLNTILEQIIDNGIKFNVEEEKKINIHFEENDNYLVFNIKDNGIGIAAEHIEKIFGMFYTLVPKDKTTDIGAGLTLVKKILSTVGGKIEVKSNLGEGSSFILFWPKKINKDG